MRRFPLQGYASSPFDSFELSLSLSLVF